MIGLPLCHLGSFLHTPTPGGFPPSLVKDGQYPQELALHDVVNGVGKMPEVDTPVVPPET